MQAEAERHNLILTRPSPFCISVRFCNRSSPASQNENHEATVSIRKSWRNIQITVDLFFDAIISFSQFGKWGHVWSASVSPLFPGIITMLRRPSCQQWEIIPPVESAYFVLPKLAAPSSRIFSSHVIFRLESPIDGSRLVIQL